MSGKSGMSVDDGANKTVLQSSMWSTKDRQIGGSLDEFSANLIAPAPNTYEISSFHAKPFQAASVESTPAIPVGS
jgi:hypothetical protein